MGLLRASGFLAPPMPPMPPSVRDTCPHLPAAPAWADAPVSGGDAEPAAPPATPRYRPLRVLGRGGSATVWLVHDTMLCREVAMKVQSAERTGCDGQGTALMSEARLAGAILHPGVVPIYDAGRLEDGRCYFTMRHVEGPSLADAIEARAQRRYDALGLRTLLGVLAAVARTVAHVHAQGISHRDLKPANILIGAGGAAFLADWGLSGPSGLSPSPSADEHAATGSPAALVLSGTLHYMAPEQVSGEARHHGPASDVYSLGVCLFEILTGTTPHHSATAYGLIFQIRHTDAPDPRTVAPQAGIGEEVASLCRAALTRDPAMRHLSAAGFADRLERALARE